MHHAIRAPVLYLPEYVHEEPARVARAWRRARRRRGYRAARRVWLGDLRRDPTPNRARRFAQALVLAEELWPEVVHLHAHFLHPPGSVARYASLVRWRGALNQEEVIARYRSGGRWPSGLPGAGGARTGRRDIPPGGEVG